MEQWSEFHEPSKPIEGWGSSSHFLFRAGVFEQCPHTVEAILKAGHEVGHNGYLHEDPTIKFEREQWSSRKPARPSPIRQS
jgi:hypothetical protein